MSAQGLHQRRQRIGEVFVLTDAKAVPRHIDAAAKFGIVRIQANESSTLVGGQHGRSLGVAALPE